MRIVAVDARTESEDARRVLALALAQAPQRLFLFGRAATLAAAQVRQAQAQRDDRYLDVAARWLLDRGAGPPPTRDGLRVPLLEIGVAVGAAPGCEPLPWTPRALELVEGQLCMAVPARSQVLPDEWDNAAVWIAGGEPAGAIHVEQDRPVVVPGVAEGGAGLAVVDVVPGEARVCLLTEQGSLGQSRSFTLGGGPRLMVQAAGGARR